MAAFGSAKQVLYIYRFIDVDAFFFFIIKGCLWNEMLIIYTLGASILSIFCMTLHRYLIVVFRINLAQKHVYISLSAIWIGLVGVVGLFVVFEDVDSAVSLQSSLLYCFIAMDYPATSNVLASLFALSFIVGTMVFLCFAYNAIVQKYFQLRANAKQKEMDASGNQPNVKISAQSSKGHQIDLSFGKRHQREKSMGVNELKLVKKSIAIGGSFIGVWLFFVAKIIYELVNQKPVSPVYDVLWGVIATWNPVLNGIILYQYDVKCKQNFNTLLGIDYFRAVSKRVLGKQKRAKTEPPQAAPKGQLNILQMDSRDVKGTIVFSKDTVGPLETVKM